MEDSKEYFDECRKINEMISNTPYASQEEVEKYHAQIIECLDSGKIISIPSQMHRNLHQIMWLKAHEIYNQFFDHLVACKDFDVKGDRKRFDVWYARVYILGRKLNEWELKVLINATGEAMQIYKHPLEELVVSDLLFQEKVLS